MEKIGKLEKENELEISLLKNENLSLKNQLDSYKDSVKQSLEKSSQLINNIKYEKLIVKLQTENETLKSDNNILKQQNNYFMNIIEQLKNQIENKGKEFYYLEKEIDDNKEIKFEEYLFKGYIHKMSKWLVTDLNQIKRNISIYFGKKIYNLTFELNNKNFNVNIEDILKIDYYHENKKRIKFIIDGDGKSK